MQEINKICADCGERKPISEFYLNRNEKDGHSRICKLDAKLREENRRRERGILPKGDNKIDDDHRRCRKCGQVKKNSEFTPRTDRRGGYRSHCKSCIAKKMEAKRRENGVQAYYNSPKSTQYLGVFLGEHVVADKVLRTWYKEVMHMPNGTPGHDFLVVDDGVVLKVEVKLGSKLRRSNEGDRWQFVINRNKIADRFFLIARSERTDERGSVRIEHIWYIPSHEIDTDQIYLTIGEFTISKWSQWEHPLDKVVACCEKEKAI